MHSFEHFNHHSTAVEHFDHLNWAVDRLAAPAWQRPVPKETFPIAANIPPPIQSFDGHEEKIVKRPKSLLGAKNDWGEEAASRWSRTDGNKLPSTLTPLPKCPLVLASSLYSGTLIFTTQRCGHHYQGCTGNNFTMSLVWYLLLGSTKCLIISPPIYSEMKVKPFSPACQS